MKHTAELDCITTVQHTLSVTLRKIPKVNESDRVVIEVTIYPDNEYGDSRGKPVVKRITLSFRDMTYLAGTTFDDLIR